MLDTYCDSLSDDAQLRMAVRLSKLALPIWESYFKEHPTDISQINALINEEVRIQGGLEKIDVEFVKRALEKIERSYAAAKEKSTDRPLPIMKSDPALTPMLATSMQPLSNKEWDKILTQSVRLVFTSVNNILIWILMRRKTPNHETHIYVAINQAIDALLRESVFSQRNINIIVEEYANDKRQDSEQSDWENALPVGRSEPLEKEDVYRMIIGEKINKGQSGSAVAKEVLRQMRFENKSYWSMMDEYLTGTSTTYSYDQEKQSFKRHEFDAIVGSFSFDTLMTETEMFDFVAQLTLGDLRESGFEV